MLGIGAILWGSVILYGIVPTVIYITIGLYILSLEHIKKRPGYKLPALIYFISVPSLIVIAITLHFTMNYMTGAFENKFASKPAGYNLYKFLVLKDIIPRSGQSLDEDKTTQTSKVAKTESTKIPKKKVEVAKVEESEQEKFKSNEKYYALVIGNNNYEHLEKLDAAQNDAEVIAYVLENKYGFEVDLLLNADYETTVDTLYDVTNKVKNNDNLLIYYAGHGELDKAENRGYWLPVDASYKQKSKWIF